MPTNGMRQPRSPRASDKQWLAGWHAAAAGHKFNGQRSAAWREGWTLGFRRFLEAHERVNGKRQARAETNL